MAIRPILTHPDDRLRALCAPVGAVTDEVRALAADLLETMYDAPGRGLAAPQVGVPSRVFVMDVAWKDGAPAPVAMVDPEVLDASPGEEGLEEACLSIPGAPRVVMRPSAVTMAWTDLAGERVHRRLTGMEARCAQHELDHLNGVLILDHG
ncbi:MAG: peptide deformylase [Hasllibacter sp.]